MSPEQAQGMIVDARSDVWSLGAVAYEVYSGRPAFEPRDTYEQMIVQIVTTKPKPLRDVAPWVPAAIARLIEEALVHDPKERLADASTFAKRLADAAKIPADPRSSPDMAYAPTALGIATPTPASDMRAVPAATNEGMVVATGSASRGSPKIMIGVLAGIFGLGALIGATVLVKSLKSDNDAKTTNGVSGVIQAPASETPPAASSSARAIPPPPVVDVPPVLASASAEAPVAVKPAAVAPRVAPRPAPPPPPPATPAPATQPPRIGDPGLSKNY
jgi:serine/threonine-protein kinase